MFAAWSAETIPPVRYANSLPGAMDAATYLASLSSFAASVPVQSRSPV